MTSRRTAKVAQAILETVSTTVLFGLKDPRVKNVTVTHVEVSGDIRSAKVYVSVMGDEKTQTLCMHGLNSARGFLQSKIGDRLRTQNTPILKFILDPGIKQSIETSKILRDVTENNNPEESSSVDENPHDESETGLPLTSRSDSDPC